MTIYTREERAVAVEPTLASGLVWLYETEQPCAALVQPQGIALPVVGDRRFVFVPDVGGQGAAVGVHVATEAHRDGPDGGPREVLTGEELADIAAALKGAHRGVHTRVVFTAGAVSGHVRLSVPAHPSLLAAVTRYRAGCPRHLHLACGYLRNTQCSWFADGFARLSVPTPPPPSWPLLRSEGVVVAPEAPRRSARNLAGLGAANQQRRERGAARAVATAGEAIATLSRRPRRSAATDEALRVLRLRVDHPEFSLRELAAAHEPPLTKDCYAARLRRALRAVGDDDAHAQQSRHTNAA
jgi:hypothetical protein